MSAMTHRFERAPALTGGEHVTPMARELAAHFFRRVGSAVQTESMTLSFGCETVVENPGHVFGTDPNAIVSDGDPYTIGRGHPDPDDHAPLPLVHIFHRVFRVS